MLGQGAASGRNASAMAKPLDGWEAVDAGMFFFGISGVRNFEDDFLIFFGDRNFEDDFLGDFWRYLL